MKKLNCNIFIIIFFSLLFLFIGNSCFAENYKIDKYSIDMNVNENNTFDITEKITANFDKRSHGIYRNIPLINTVRRLDGSKSENRAKITNINVNQKFSKSYLEGNLVLKIGSASQYIFGTHYYTISYNYNIGKDPIKGADELYFNLIGDGWDLDINNIDFKINMPKKFDSTSLEFLSSKREKINNVDVEHTVDGNIISGSLKHLNPETALTVRLTLPESYFVKESLNIDFVSIFIIISCVLCIVVAFRFWFKYGKDDKVINTVEFYPPDGLNPAELAYFYNGLNSNKEVISLLFYLANKGYLKIEETNKKETGYSFKITKLKDYDGNNLSEEIFMVGLFLEKDYATDKTLENKFYATISFVSKAIKKEYESKLYTNYKKSKQNKIVKCMIVYLTIIAFFIPYLNVSDTFSYIEISGILVILFFLLYVTIDLYKSKLLVIVEIFLCGILLFFLSSLAILMVISNLGFFALVAYFIEIISFIVMLVFFKLLRKRNSYGTQILGRIRGFRHFLKVAKKEELEAIIKEKPQYFYDMIPYAYALGVTDKWVKKFEVIATQQPNWYSSYDTFSYVNFERFINKTTKFANTNTTSHSKSFNGGGFSGGFSGGGSGGGGGGSW